MYTRYSLEQRKEFLEMNISGEYQYWDLIKYPKIIRNQCLKVHVYKILVDLRDMEIRQMPVVEQFFIGEHIAEVFKDHIKIAIVWNGLYHSRFFQSVATNRAALLRVFRSEKNAEIWLLRDKENEPVFDNSNH
ncbi:MAG: hypothetical protein WBM43_02835 [Flavobacteriaceae bacterium]